MSIYAFHSQNKPLSSLPVSISMRWRINTTKTLDTQEIITSSSGNKIKYKPTYGVLLRIPGYNGVTSVVIPLFFQNWKSSFITTETCEVQLDLGKILDKYMSKDIINIFNPKTTTLKFLPYIFYGCGDSTQFGWQSAAVIEKNTENFYNLNRYHVKAIKGHCKYYDGVLDKNMDYNLPADKGFTVDATVTNEFLQVANLMTVAVNNQLYNPDRKPTPDTYTSFRNLHGMYTVNDTGSKFITELPVKILDLFRSGKTWQDMNLKMTLYFDIEVSDRLG